MKRITTYSLLLVVIGIGIGWLGNSYFGPKGIQSKFNEAAMYGDVSEMERLISHGADPLGAPFFEGPNDYGFPAITVAASFADPRAVEFLLSKGADPNFLSTTETPLDLAIYKREEAEEVIEILRKNGGKTLVELNKKQTEQDAASDR